MKLDAVVMGRRSVRGSGQFDVLAFIVVTHDRFRRSLHPGAHVRGRAALLVMLCVLLASTVACASRPGAAGADAAPTAAAVMDGDPQRPAAARWLRTELYFATGRADGPSARGVSPVAWQEFLDEAVTPRFPDGFTVHDAYGQWRSRDGTRIGRLHSKVIVILHPDSEDARSRVEAVRRAFKARTGQDSVLRATAPVEVSF